MRRHGVDIGRRLRRLRTEIGLTQEVLARRARISAKFISEIENGHSSPTVDVLGRIAEGLGLPLSGFFAADLGSLRDDLARLVALFASQSPVMRRRALRVLRALADE